jgi:hypothetical protein
MVGNTVLRNLTGCPIFDDGENLFLGAIGPRERGKAVVSDIEGHLGESLLGVPFLAIGRVSLDPGKSLGRTFERMFGKYRIELLCI